MADTLSLEIPIDGVPYAIKAESQYFNDQLQYKVTVNDTDQVTFLFDEALGRYTAVGDDSIEIPDSVEEAIGAKLNSDSLKR